MNAESKESCATCLHFSDFACKRFPDRSLLHSLEDHCRLFYWELKPKTLPVKQVELPEDISSTPLFG